MLAQAHGSPGSSPAGRSPVVLHLNASHGLASPYTGDFRAAVACEALATGRIHHATRVPARNMVHAGCLAACGDAVAVRLLPGGGSRPCHRGCRRSTSPGCGRPVPPWQDRLRPGPRPASWPRPVAWKCSGWSRRHHTAGHRRQRRAGYHRAQERHRRDQPVQGLRQQVPPLTRRGARAVYRTGTVPRHRRRTRVHCSGYFPPARAHRKNTRQHSGRRILVDGIRGGIRQPFVRFRRLTHRDRSVSQLKRAGLLTRISSFHARLETS